MDDNKKKSLDAALKSLDKAFGKGTILRLADKEVEKMVKMIAPLADKVITLAPHSSRAEKSDKLKEVVLKYNKNCISLEEYKEALDVAMSEAQKDDLIVVSGSLYMIGDMRKIINNL